MMNIRNMILSRFRYDDSAILSTLLNNKNEKASIPSHAAIMKAYRLYLEQIEVDANEEPGYR